MKAPTTQTRTNCGADDATMAPAQDDPRIPVHLIAATNRGSAPGVPRNPQHLPG